LETVVLAGGLGTRLRSEVDALPKVLAPINGEPFLNYLLNILQKNSVTKCILATGYLHEKIIEAFGDEYHRISLSYSQELEPLGTGGAIQLALEKTVGENIFIVNGDTLFDVPLEDMLGFHSQKKSDITLALKPMKDFSRYGTVELSDENRIVNFQERLPVKQGLINGGVYIIKRDLLKEFSFLEKFSFEEDFLKLQCGHLKMYGFVFDGYFIDIGIPEDFHRAQKEFVRFL